MKKLVFALLAGIASATMCQAANMTTYSDSTNSKAERAMKEYSVDIKTVKGPDGTSIKVFSKTYLYPEKTIEAAIKERLKNEGMSTKNFKNDFFGCKEVNYNALWSRTCDFYVGVVGSKSAGTVNLVISTGYDNYLDESNAIACLNAAKWLKDVEHTIEMYVYNDNLTEQKETLADMQKDLEKLKKEKLSIENKMDDQRGKITEFEAQRLKVDEVNSSSVDTKQMDKEQKQGQKLQNKLNELNYDLNEVELKIEQTQEKIKQQEKTLEDLRKAVPVKE